MTVSERNARRASLGLDPIEVVHARAYRKAWRTNLRHLSDDYLARAIERRRSLLVRADTIANVLRVAMFRAEMRRRARLGGMGV
jgi:hypothetical protein